MAVIKQGNSCVRGGDAVARDIGDSARAARAIVAEAHLEAQKVIAEARERARAMTSAAEARGHAEGWARGLEEGRTKGCDDSTHEVLQNFAPALAALAAGWTSALEEWRQTRQTLIDTARHEVLEFALAVAQKVVHRLIEVDPSLVIEQVRAALELVVQPRQLAIAVHPADHPIVQRALPALATRSLGSPDVQIIEREDVARGGCVISTAGGTVDAQIDAQIARIAEMLLPARRPPVIEAPPGAGDAP